MRLNILYVLLLVIFTSAPISINAQSKAWAMLQDGVMTFSYGQKPKGPDKVKCSSCQNMQLSSSNFCSNCGSRLEKGFEIFEAFAKNDHDFRYWNYDKYAHTIKKVIILPSFKQVYPTDISFFFDNMENLIEIVGIENLNTSRVTNMESLFGDCAKLTTINLSHFNTSNVTNMDMMFCGCSSVSSLDVSHFNTSNVTNMGGMFMWCYNLERLDVSRFNTTKVTSFDSMFSRCKKLTSLNLLNFKTENGIHFGEMFNECIGLTTLDISNFNTRKAEDMDGMFDECSNLKTIYVSATNWVEHYEYNHNNYTGVLCNRYNPWVTCSAKIVKK